MPRRKRTDKRRHEVTIELLCVLANMYCGGGPEEWEQFWGGREEGQAAFDALRDSTAGTNRERVLQVQDGETYEAWLERPNRSGAA